MKKILVVCLVLLAFPPNIFAHEGDAIGAGVTGHATDEGNVVEGSIVVMGSVAELRERLYRVEAWPQTFSDARAVVPLDGGPWSVDFVHFQHPHDFNVVRGGNRVVLTLADESHGLGRFEYTLAPLDAERSILTVRFEMGTPPTMTAQQAATLLRSKATNDLEDFAYGISL